MLQKNYFFFLFILIVILQSCSYSSRRIYYAPEEHNALKLAKKNEVKTAFSTTNLTSEEYSNTKNFNAQIAYSPVKHLGVFGNFTNWKNSGNNFDFPDYQPTSHY